jgi:hypothetical protein
MTFRMTGNIIPDQAQAALESDLHQRPNLLRVLLVET